MQVTINTLAMKKLIVGIAVAGTLCVLGVALALILIFVVFSSSPSTVVTTPSGAVITGKRTTTRSGTDVYAYYNIPYAAAPVGTLRFQPPNPTNYSSFNATADDTIACIQVSRWLEI